VITLHECQLLADTGSSPEGQTLPRASATAGTAWSSFHLLIFIVLAFGLLGCCLSSASAGVGAGAGDSASA